MITPQGAAPRRRPLGGARSEAGFTLLELMLIVGIIAILISIALPTFFSARQKAQHHAAQSTLRTALEAANAAYVDSQDFGTMTAAVLAGQEIGPKFADVPVGSTNLVHVRANYCDCNGLTGVGFIALAAPAGDGTCWYVFQTNDGAPGYGKGNAAGDGTCDATNAQGVNSPQFPI